MWKAASAITILSYETIFWILWDQKARLHNAILYFSFERKNQRDKSK